MDIFFIVMTITHNVAFNLGDMHYNKKTENVKSI